MFFSISQVVNYVHLGKIQRLFNKWNRVPILTRFFFSSFTKKFCDTYPSCYVFCKWSFSRLLKSWPLVCVMASVKHNNKGRGWTLSPLRFCLIMCETALQFVVINQEQLEQQRALNVSQNCHLTSTMSRLNMGQRGKHQGAGVFFLRITDLGSLIGISAIFLPFWC